MLMPKYMFLTKGVGRHRERLGSFEMALRDAGIAFLNLVDVSSIYPPQCKILSKKEGLTHLHPGQVVHWVGSRIETDEPGRMIAAATGLAIPKDKKMYGYLSEHHAYGQTAGEAAKYSEDLAATMLASTLGFEVDPDTSYDERKQVYRMSGKIVTTKALSAAARGVKGKWTCVLAAAVLIVD